MRAFPAFAITFFAALCVTGETEACWWLHHCHCHHHGSSYRSASPTAAPVRAPVTAAAPAAAARVSQVVAAPMYYQPVMMAQAAPMQAPAQFPGLGGISGLGNLLGLVSGGGGGGDLGNIVKLLEMLKTLRDRKPDTGSGNGGSGGTVDLSSVTAALKKLEDGQEYLKGQHINTASILQSIGKELVDSRGKATGDLSDLDSKLEAAIGNRLDAESPIGKKLRRLEEKLGDLQESLDDMSDRIPEFRAEEVPAPAVEEDEPSEAAEEVPEGDTTRNKVGRQVYVSHRASSGQATERHPVASHTRRRPSEEAEYLIPYMEKRR